MADLEQRYIVFKIKDVQQLTQQQKDALYIVEHAVQQLRYERGADPGMPCLVVEKDWPEYEPTLAAILARADSAVAQPEPWPEGWDGRDKAAFQRAIEGEEAWRKWGKDFAADGVNACAAPDCDCEPGFCREQPVKKNVLGVVASDQPQQENGNG